MRGWGITFIATAVGCVVLPDPLAFILIAVVAVAGVVALATAIADHNIRVEALAAADTAKTMAHLKLLDHMDDEADAEWADILAAIDQRPLGVKTPQLVPGQIRTITPRIPTPRRPGSAS